MHELVTEEQLIEKEKIISNYFKQIFAELKKEVIIVPLTENLKLISNK